MPVHPFDDLNVVVQPSVHFYFFYRDQGVSVAASSPSTTLIGSLVGKSIKVERIECSIVLTGLGATSTAQASCANCLSLRVHGDPYWGVNVPQAYSSVSYSGNVIFNGTPHRFSGTLTF